MRNLEFYIAKRIHFRQDRRNISRPAVRIAISGMALGLVVMWIAVAVVIGFKQEIRSKTIGFGGHIQISALQSQNSYDFLAIQKDSFLISKLRGYKEVKAVQTFITKPGIIKTNESFQGIIVKGIGADFNWDFFDKHLEEGERPDLSDSLTNEVVISRSVSEMLKLKLGDSFFAYFVQDQVRARKFKVAAIYQTYFEEYDKLFVLADIRHLQNLNAWPDNYVSAYEVILDDYEQMQVVAEDIMSFVFQNEDNLKDDLLVKSVRDLNPQIYAWLDLLDLNVWVILVLMLLVAGFNMISGLLILILERTNMIGILKSVGATNWSVRKIFLYHSSFLIGKGMMWGNLIGFTVCIIQYYTHIIPLDPASYYTSYVPISFNWIFILGLNVGTIIASLLMMIGPSWLITKILPSKIIRYE